MLNFKVNTLVLFLSTITSANFNISKRFTKQTLSEYLSEMPSLWTTREISNETMEYYKSLIGVALPTTEEREEIEKENEQTDRKIVHTQYYKLPKYFNALERWPECASIIGTIQDQARCSSCWAVASTSAMSDRVCIGSRGRRKIQISANDLMSCCTDCQMSKGDGCKTGYTHKAWKYYQREGIVSGGTFASHSGCKPYPFYRSLFFETQESGECIKECKNGQSYDKDKHFGGVVTFPRSAEAIQREVFHNGPMVVHINLYEDLLHYQSGIYYHREGARMGLHLLKIIGWSEQDGIPYWLCQNTWGESWGDRGRIKIVRGINHIGIERAGITSTYNYTRSSASSV